MKKISLTLALVTCAFVAQGASNTSSGIAGKVMDSHEQSIAGVEVTLKSTTTNRTITHYTNAKGRYHFNGLRPASNYVLTFTNDVDSHSVEDISLELGRTSRFDAILDGK